MNKKNKLRPINTENKKALSNIIAYVLLISITVALSVMVYNWLRFYVSEEETPTCPEGTSIIIKEHQCYTNNKIEVTLKNKGRFTIEGFKLRIHDRKNAEFRFYTLNETGTKIEPGEEHKTTSYIDGSTNTEHNFTNITLIEIQPYIKEKNKNITCKNTAIQTINNCKTTTETTE